MIISLLSTIAPSYTAKRAFDFLSNPQVKKIRPYELDLIKSSTQTMVDFNDRKIATYVWNEGHEKILLVHGWEGQASNFADLIHLLIEKNYTVIAYDAPAHGFSSTGPTSFIEYADSVAFMIKQHGIKKIVSHSFGGVGTVYGLFKNKDIFIDKYCLLTTPDTFRDRINFVSDTVGISGKVKLKFIAIIEAAYGIKVDE